MGKGGAAARGPLLSQRCPLAVGLAVLTLLLLPLLPLSAPSSTARPGASLWSPGLPLRGLAAQEPPDTTTTPVDSTRLKIMNQLEALRRGPGVDSTWFLPDSLLPDSVLQAREAQLGRGGRGRGVRPGEGTAPGTLAGGDSTVLALLELEEYSVTEYQGRSADFDAGERELILRGTPEAQARLIRDGEELTSDSALVYSEDTQRVWSLGSEAAYKPRNGDAVNTRVIVFDLNEERGSALGARTTYSAGADWILHGDLTSVSEAAIFGDKVRFTSCELDEPHYHFAADNVKIVADNIMVARPVKLYFADVPVAWLPFIVQSTEQGRTSGLLTPGFSVNDIVRTSQGYSRRLQNVGFYWAMSDYYDATVALDWWSDEFLALTGVMRYEWARQFLSGNLNFKRYWRSGGQRELTMDASSNWQMDERTSFRLQARYATSTSFVRRTSFDPRQVVQSINSDGGLSRRFDFGNLSLSANSRQYLSDDRLEMTLPSVNFSLSPQTFFQASPAQARFYNNMTWSGSANYRRSITDRAVPADTTGYSESLLDNLRMNAGFNQSITLGNLSLSSSLGMNQTVKQGVPIFPEDRWKEDALADPGSEDPPPDQTASGPVFGDAVDQEDQAETDVDWNTSLNYQQRLIGSTTITPSLRLSGRLRRSDLDSLASDGFVSAPTRLSLAASLKTDLYGFFPGFASFEAIRHKFSPSFDFSYAPEVSPSQTQIDVFGSREVGAQRTLRIGLSQTFEAKLKEEAAEEFVASRNQALVDSLTLVADSLVAVADTLSGGTQDPLSQGADSLRLYADSLRMRADSLAATGGQPEELEGGLRRPPQAPKVTLLALRTSALTYDFERADESGNWLDGWTQTTLSNNISSDYLRGLTISVAHDLFEQEGTGGGGGAGGDGGRSFSPHLSRMNLSFSLNSQSGVVRALGGLLGAEGEDAGPVPEASQGEDVTEEDPFAGAGMEEAAVIPEVSGSRPTRRTGGGGQGWRASLSYSLQRPRDETRPANQMIQSTLTFTPTEKWDVNWRTSYDVENGGFNDHLIRLTRDLHRWEAHFDFRQTATGNWSFRFEVALTDNRDLHFDYQQRSIQDASGRRRF